MKKLLITLFLSTTLPLSAVVWQPSVAFGLGYIGNIVDNDTEIWDSLLLSAEISPASFSFRDSHRLDVPITLSFVSESSEKDRLSLPYYLEGNIALSYGFMITENMEVSAKAGPSLVFHLKQHALSWGVMAAAALTVNLNQHLSLTLPFSYRLRPGVSSFSAAIGLKYFPGGSL